MENRPFSDNSLKPTEDTIKKNLYSSYKFYNELDNITFKFKKDWNFAKSSGWMLKVHDGKKALYYLIPLNNSFIISLTLREQEKSEFLSNDNLIELHEQLKNAKKYSEGFALKFLISDSKSYTPLVTLIKKLIEKRK